MARIDFSKLQRNRGLALVETSIVILLLLFVTFAMMEYGWIFHRIQQLNNGAREGVRQAVLPDNTGADAIAAVDTLMGDFGITGYTVDVNPGAPEDLESGELITVTVTVPVGNIDLTGLFLDELFLGSSLSTSATMAKEGP
jgi:Flp pilus assembly protein TadG